MYVKITHTFDEGRRFKAGEVLNVSSPRARRWIADNKAREVEQHRDAVGGDPYSDYLLAKHGLTLTGSSDETARFQALMDEITWGNTRRGIVFPEPGLVLRIDAPGGVGLVFDASTLGHYNFNSATVDCALAGSATVFRISADKDKTVTPANTSYGNAQGSLNNFTLVGPGFASGGKGIQFNQPSGVSNTDPGPNRLGLRHFVIDGFGTGIDHYHHSYAESVQHGEVLHCANGLVMRNAPADGGERSTYSDVLIYNNTRGVVVGEGATTNGNTGTWFKLGNCSIDYNQVQCLVANGAKLGLLECHVEGDATAAYYPGTTPFLASGAGSVIRAIGGQVVYPSTSGRTLDYIVNNSVPSGQGGVYFRGTNFYNCYTNTDYFATGVGETLVDDLTGISADHLPLLISTTGNLLNDGGFENAAVPDLVQINGDTGTIVARLAGTNITVSSVTGETPRTGGRNLKAVKAGAAATTAQFVVLVPWKDNRKRLSWKGYGRKSVAGTIAIKPIYASILPGTTAGVTDIALKTLASAADVNFTSTTGAWVETKSLRSDRKTPHESGHRNPTHAGLYIVMDAVAAHTFSMDDLDIQAV